VGLSPNEKTMNSKFLFLFSAIATVTSAFLTPQSTVYAQTLPTLPDVPVAPLPNPNAVPPSPAPGPLAPSAPPTNNTDASGDLYFLSRAKNLARQAGINANGGLINYRPEAAMFGPALQSPFVRKADGSVTFTFKGGTPGQATGSIETVATVYPNGTVTVEYNGPPQGGAIGGGDLGGTTAQDTNASTLAILDQAAFLGRSRNLARQAAINANGGLDAYRPEASMFGPTSTSPHKFNSDQSVTFTFKGGSPVGGPPTVETEVRVSRDNTVTVEYNGPIR
jgi:hypothetical protein